MQNGWSCRVTYKYQNSRNTIYQKPESLYYDCPPNKMLLLHVLPKQLWHDEAWIQQDLWVSSDIWYQQVISRSTTPVSYEVVPPLIGLCVPKNTTYAWLDWCLGNLEAKETSGTNPFVVQTISWTFNAVWHCALSYWRKTLLLNNTFAMKESTWSATMFR